jgi:hypothetical protein
VIQLFQAGNASPAADVTATNSVGCSYRLAFFRRMITAVGLNGIRISKASNADVTPMDMDRRNRTLTILATAGSTSRFCSHREPGERSINESTERASGPIFIGSNGDVTHETYLAGVSTNYLTSILLLPF